MVNHHETTIRGNRLKTIIQPFFVKVNLRIVHLTTPKCQLFGVCVLDGVAICFRELFVKC